MHVDGLKTVSECCNISFYLVDYLERQNGSETYAIFLIDILFKCSKAGRCSGNWLCLQNC